MSYILSKGQMQAEIMLFLAAAFTSV